MAEEVGATNGIHDFAQQGASLSSENTGAEFAQFAVNEEANVAENGKEGEDGDEPEEDNGYLDPNLLTEATLPISNISRLMKKALPRQAKVSSSAKDLIQECCIEFISFLTSEANDKCLAEKRKTINGDDILFAMNTLSFEEYEAVCRIWLSRYRIALDFANREKGGSANAQTGASAQARGRSTLKRTLSDADQEGD